MLAAALAAALVTGCSSNGPSAAQGRASSPVVPVVGDSCKANRSKCLYNGSYEAGERDYAEAEARRLNLAESERLRRSMGK